MSDIDELDLKIKALRESGNAHDDYSSRMNELLIARERAQEKQFKKSLARRAKLTGGKR